MTPITPHIISALYSWITHNDMTPHLLIDASADNVFVPEELVNDGKIVLNIAPSAIEAFDIDDDGITFCARFTGTQHDIYLPINSVVSIYAKETGQGMIFTPEGNTMDEPPKPEPPKTKPKLKVLR